MNDLSLTELADRYKSDKGMLRLPHHGYTFVYEMLFNPLRHKPVSLLELGLARTSEDYRGRSETRSCTLSPSVEMWLQYFDHAHVTGFDLSDFSQHKDSRFTFIQGDLGNSNDYNRILENDAAFDIVIDDGSHASFHQMLAFSKLFSAVKDGGYYIIEDTWSQPASIEKKNPVSHTISALFRKFMELGYFPETSPLPSTDLNRYLGEINNILFVPYHNLQGGSDQMIVIQKKGGSRFHHYRSKVRFFRNPPDEEERSSLCRNADVSPDNPYPRYYLAMLDVACNDLPAAWDNIEMASELSENDPEIILLRIKLIFERGEVEKAVLSAMEYMQDKVAREVIGLSFSEFLIDREAFDGADRLLKEIIASEPDSSRGYFLIGKLAEARGQLADAEANYMRAYEILPTRLKYLKSYARIARKRKSPELIDFLLKQGPVYSGQAEYRVLLANIYIRYGRTQDALEQAHSLAADSDLSGWARDFIERYSASA